MVSRTCRLGRTRSYESQAKPRMAATAPSTRRPIWLALGSEVRSGVYAPTPVATGHEERATSPLSGDDSQTKALGKMRPPSCLGLRALGALRCPFGDFDLQRDRGLEKRNVPVVAGNRSRKSEPRLHERGGMPQFRRRDRSESGECVQLFRHASKSKPISLLAVAQVRHASAAANKLWCVQ